MTTLPDYLHAAAALLDSALLQAIRTSHTPGSNTADVELLMEAAEWAGRRRVAARLNVVGDEGRIVLAGILAGHVLRERATFDGDDDVAALIGDNLRAMWADDLGERLTAAKNLVPVQNRPGGTRELITVLHRAQGTELVAASGQLARAVIKGGGGGLAEAWFTCFGTYVLAANRLVRPAATKMARAGFSKRYIAAKAGVSPQTVYNWSGAGGFEPGDRFGSPVARS